MPSLPPALADAIFWIAVAACAVAQVAILRSVLVVRPRADGPLQRPSDRVQPAPLARRPLEVFWAVVPALALAATLALTWRALHPGAGLGPGAGADAGAAPAAAASSADASPAAAPRGAEA